MVYTVVVVLTFIVLSGKVGIRKLALVEGCKVCTQAVAKHRWAA